MRAVGVNSSPDWPGCDALLRRRPRQQLVDLAGGPVGDQPHPFAHRRFGPPQPVDATGSKTSRDRRARRPANPPDRPRPQIPPCGTGRPIAACERPTSPAASARRPSASTSALENSAFSSVLRERRSMISRDLAMPRLFEDRAGEIGFPRIVRDQIGAAAGEHDARVRIAVRQRRRRDDAVGRAAHHRRAMRGRKIGLDRRAEHDDAVRRAARRHPTAESAAPADRAT